MKSNLRELIILSTILVYSVGISFQTGLLLNSLLEWNFAILPLFLLSLIPTVTVIIVMVGIIVSINKDDNKFNPKS